MNDNSKEKETVIEPDEINDIDYDKLNSISKDILGNEQKRFQFYEKLRLKLAGKLPQKGIFNKVTDYLFLLPDFFMLLSRMLTDERVDNKTKTYILGIIAYIALPIDIIPDFIPVIGFADDLIIVVFALDHVLKNIDEQILLEHWSGNADLILSIKKILAIVDSSVGQRVLLKIKNFLFKAKHSRF